MLRKKIVDTILVWSIPILCTGPLVLSCQKDNNSLRNSLINIPNNGNRCWMASSIQMILAIPPLTRFMHQYGAGDYKLQPSFYDFFCHYWTAQNNTDLQTPLDTLMSIMYDQGYLDNTLNRDGSFNHPSIEILCDALWEKSQEEIIWYNKQRAIRIKNPFYQNIEEQITCSQCNISIFIQDNNTRRIYTYPFIKALEEKKQTTLNKHCKTCRKTTNHYTTFRLKVAPAVFITETMMFEDPNITDFTIEPEIQLPINNNQQSYILYGVLVQQNKNHHIALIRFLASQKHIISQKLYNDFYLCDSLSVSIPTLVNNNTLETYLKITPSAQQWAKTYALYIAKNFIDAEIIPEKTATIPEDQIATSLQDLHRALQLIATVVI